VRVAAALEAMGTKTVPTAGNFLMIEAGPDAMRRYEALLRAGVIVRPLANYQLTQHLRVTLGTVEQNDRFLAAWRTVLVA
jgi:histidinol-phosphate aminotransferase